MEKEQHQVMMIKMVKFQYMEILSVFCRLVNNDETWPYYLSKIIDKKVSNFGVEILV